MEETTVDRQTQSKKRFRKIVYFDRETISNSLQSSNGGSYKKVRESTGTRTLDVDAETDLSASVAVSVPFLARLKFVLTGRLNTKYIHEWANKTTVTSTDISQFEESKSLLAVFEDVKLTDIVNSLTSLRFLAAMGKMVGSLLKEVDLKELSKLLNDLEGYDVFDIGKNRYVRFNQNAYLSNYKRNDLSMARLDLYCVKVGTFYKTDFDYMDKLSHVQTIVNINDQNKTLADIMDSCDSGVSGEVEESQSSGDMIQLYDAVCAYVNEAKQ